MMPFDPLQNMKRRRDELGRRIQQLERTLVAAKNQLARLEQDIKNYKPPKDYIPA